MWGTRDNVTRKYHASKGERFASKPGAANGAPRTGARTPPSKTARTWRCRLARDTKNPSVHTAFDLRRHLLSRVCSAGSNNLDRIRSASGRTPVRYVFCSGTTCLVFARSSTWKTCERCHKAAPSDSPSPTARSCRTTSSVGVSATARLLGVAGRHRRALRLPRPLAVEIVQQPPSRGAVPRPRRGQRSRLALTPDRAAAIAGTRFRQSMPTS